MRPSILFRNAALALLALVAADARAVTIDWTSVGNPGNANDPNTGGFYGAVGYGYNIDKYDVTNSQYAEFLNAKDPTGANTFGLWNSFMNDAQLGGISFNAGNPNGSKYTLISSNQNRPADFVNWYSAIRFANWLNNGQGNGDTETGAYSLGSLGSGGVPVNGNSITRNAGAKVFLPSENEWYKAAYYNPATNSYFQFPTSSNTIPIASSPTSLPNHVNTDEAAFSQLTDVGAYSGTTSPYGAFDMGGNLWQWNEALINGSHRGMRGGEIGDNVIFTASGSWASANPSGETNVLVDVFGFRVAETPEPSSLVLAALGFICLCCLRRR